jgi:hypothetical protein
MEQRVNSNKLFNIATGVYRTACLTSAIELGVFENLKDGNKLDKF